MKVQLGENAYKKICLAVSGGRDSMALLHYLKTHAGKLGISLCAVNCEHGLRGEKSKADSAFVKDKCEEWGVPLACYTEDCAALAKKYGMSVETAAREWRRQCYFSAAAKFGADAIATAHHLNDNAETVLFNLSRGAYLAGASGISFEETCQPSALITTGNMGMVNALKTIKIIRPLIACTREEITEYVQVNSVPYVEDESNLLDDYTRNRIRHKVLPELEKAVPGAAESLYRFSRLAAEDEEYFNSLIAEQNLIKRDIYGVHLSFCGQKPVFKRAAVCALKQLRANVKDYTSAHLERLYNLQFAENGKKFGFLNFMCFKEDGKIVICDEATPAPQTFEAPFADFVNGTLTQLGGQYVRVLQQNPSNEGQNNPTFDSEKVLKLDLDKIPAEAVMRFALKGDKFTKFGGGTKPLGDYFTDKKMPVRLRNLIPLIAVGPDILAVCGVEISEKVKITEQTKRVAYVCCTDFLQIK